MSKSLSIDYRESAEEDLNEARLGSLEMGGGGGPGKIISIFEKGTKHGLSHNNKHTHKHTTALS